MGQEAAVDASTNDHQCDRRMGDKKNEEKKGLRIQKKVRQNKRKMIKEIYGVQWYLDVG